jgi:hypothetical protein
MGYIADRRARKAIDAINAALEEVRQLAVASRGQDTEQGAYRNLCDVRNSLIRKYYVDVPDTDFEAAMRGRRQHSAGTRRGL